MANDEVKESGVCAVSTEKRLRSEASPSPDRTKRAKQTLAEKRLNTIRQRRELVAHYREWLERSVAVDGTFEQEMLILVACSAALEIHTLHSRFEQCLAKHSERDRLGRARAELVRALRALGLPKIKTEGADNHASIDKIRRDIAAKRKAGAL